MRRISHFTSAALGAVLMMAVLPEASAQMYREEAAPNVPLAPPGAGRMPGGWSPGMGGEDWQDPAGLLQQADAAVVRGQMTLATELLERAETRLLSRSVDAGAISTPALGGAPAEIASARQAVMKGDRLGARQRIRMALDAVNRGGMTGDDAPPMPGGGPTIIVPGGAGSSTVIVR